MDLIDASNISYISGFLWLGLVNTYHITTKVHFFGLDFMSFNAKKKDIYLEDYLDSCSLKYEKQYNF